MGNSGNLNFSELSFLSVNVNEGGGRLPPALFKLSKTELEINPISVC